MAIANLKRKPMRKPRLSKFDVRALCRVRVRVLYKAANANNLANANANSSLATSLVLCVILYYSYDSILTKCSFASSFLSYLGVLKPRFLRVGVFF